MGSHLIKHSPGVWLVGCRNSFEGKKKVQNVQKLDTFIKHFLL